MTETSTAPSASAGPDGASAPAPTPFHDLEQFVALPRLGGLAMSPDGSRLVTTVATLEPQAHRVRHRGLGGRPRRRGARPPPDPQQQGRAPAPRSPPTATCCSLSARPGPRQRGDGRRRARRAVAPARRRRRGTRRRHAARRRRRRRGGRTRTGRRRRPTLPGAVAAEDDEKRRKARKEKKVAAILHDGYPVRYWDHDLGPDRAAPARRRRPTGGGRRDDRRGRDLTPAPGARRSFEDGAEVSPDGRTVVSAWRVDDPRARPRGRSWRSTWRPASARALVDDPDDDLGPPAHLARRPHRRGRSASGDTEPTAAPRLHAVVMPVAGRRRVALARGGLGPLAAAPRAGRRTARALLVAADDDGRAPMFRVDLADRRRHAADQRRRRVHRRAVTPDGARRLRAALRLRGAAAPGPDRRPPRRTSEPRPARPAADARAARHADEVERRPRTAAAARLARAAAEGRDRAGAAAALDPRRPAAARWNAWSWRWNPWILAARGYAVLLPDPALSTGYGQDVRPGRLGRAGARAPYTDLHGASPTRRRRRDDIDATRTAAMGGSFGGYMANWVAGHTDRFRAIVTHASLWALDQFGPTTDDAYYWGREMTEEMARRQLPAPVRRRDHARRCSSSTATRTTACPSARGCGSGGTCCQRASEDADGQPAPVPVLPRREPLGPQPQHAVVWYETVLAFLAHHLLGADFVVPDRLR